MSQSSVKGVRLVGIASAVPDIVVDNETLSGLFGAAEIKKIINSTGIKSRRIAPKCMCTSDMCLAAAEKLIEEAGWDRSSIDTLIFVTQTPDYILPATSCSLHGRLGLDKSCNAFDVNLGCSGYTHGLWLASHLIASGASKRALLLAGETASHPVYPEDRSASPLFGDAGTATLLERAETEDRIYFRGGTDGSGQNHLIIRGGGFRLPTCSATGVARKEGDGNTRALGTLYMNGAEIFLFTLAEVPNLVEEIRRDAGWDDAEVDAYVFHQANRFMLKHLASNMELEMPKVPLSLENFGNTSSASIPLTMTTQMRESLSGGSMNLILAGFGVGLSWSAVALRTDHLVMPELVQIDTKRFMNQLIAAGGAEGAEHSHLSEEIKEAIHEITG